MGEGDKLVKIKFVKKLTKRKRLLPEIFDFATKAEEWLHYCDTRFCPRLQARNEINKYGEADYMEKETFLISQNTNWKLAHESLFRRESAGVVDYSVAKSKNYLSPLSCDIYDC